MPDLCVYSTVEARAKIAIIDKMYAADKKKTMKFVSCCSKSDLSVSSSR